MNGYFQLQIGKRVTGLKLFPPRDDGKPIDVAEIMAYLRERKIEPIDMVALSRSVSSLKDEPMTIELVQRVVSRVNEGYRFKVSEDGMLAVARFYPPSEEGERLTREELITALNQQKIVVGIDMDVVEDFLENRQYCTDYVIARGREPRQGKDAEIEYFFNTDLSSKPTVREDGSVDFFHLNTINHCTQGQLLARLTKAVPSFPGSDVHGGIIKGREVKRLTLKHGRNMEVSEDGLELYSTINGHVSLTEDTVFVSDVFEVENVGPATGNIESAGSVLVTGNVQAGFRIEAKGNVEVRGVVEGATIDAGGDIIIGRGMNGMGKGKLFAGGRIIAKYIENSTISCAGYIQAESILLSNVNAGTEIEVDGKRGIIAGGIIRATEKITCKTLGSPMGADTAVEVGVDPMAKERFQFLQKDLSDIQRNMRNIKQVIDNAQQKLNEGAKLKPEQLKYFQTLVQSYKQLEKKLDQELEEYGLLETTLKSNGDACVIVKGEVHPGTKITVADASMIVKTTIKYCRLEKSDGEVKFSSL
ncbi:MAG: DUF342 domain-containing protein [Lachnospiraceae bacterium]|nr:DUF342 domain-containing protein [Lachnospiraceae bacterium]